MRKKRFGLSVALSTPFTEYRAIDCRAWWRTPVSKRAA
jgi:hypothetical protein